MAIVESIITATFMIIFVFFVLTILFGLIKLMSYLLICIDQALVNKQSKTSEMKTVTDVNKNKAVDGALILQDVNEPTAAMIMAIVSHESGIPLSKLCFKSIKAVPKISA